MRPVYKRQPETTVRRYVPLTIAGLILLDDLQRFPFWSAPFGGPSLGVRRGERELVEITRHRELLHSTPLIPSAVIGSHYAAYLEAAVETDRCRER